jgi:hypothetical protein
MMNDAPANPPPLPNQTLILIRGIGGAIVGGAVGYFIFVLLLRNGLYSSMLPGVLLGVGAGLAARGRSPVLGVICAVASIPLAVIGEWSVMPFVQDKSLAFFVTHVHKLPPLHLVMMALGTAAAWWFGQGR